MFTTSTKRGRHRAFAAQTALVVLAGCGGATGGNNLENGSGGAIADAGKSVGGATNSGGSTTSGGNSATANGSTNAACQGLPYANDSGSPCVGGILSRADAGTQNDTSICTFSLPTPPPGQSLAPASIHVLLTVPQLGAEEYSYADSPSNCSADKGFNVDNPANPTQVILCACVCQRSTITDATIGYTTDCHSANVKQ